MGTVVKTKPRAVPKIFKEITDPDTDVDENPGTSPNELKRNLSSKQSGRNIWRKNILHSYKIQNPQELVEDNFD